jgi:hypothetical protein
MGSSNPVASSGGSSFCDAAVGGQVGKKRFHFQLAHLLGDESIGLSGEPACVFLHY